MPITPVLWSIVSAATTDRSGESAYIVRDERRDMHAEIYTGEGGIVISFKHARQAYAAGEAARLASVVFDYLGDTAREHDRIEARVYTNEIGMGIVNIGTHDKAAVFIVAAYFGDELASLL